jgi:type II secretory pathway pseudopilin PulG
MIRRGAILLEVILSVALFSMGALAILTQLSQGARGLEATRLAAQAADLAATTMARIEAGLAAPEALSGPAERWDAEQRASLADALDPGAPMQGAASPEGPSAWRLEVMSEPAPFEGLTLIEVTATYRDPLRPGAVGASYTLRQLVRLGTAADDTIGGTDALMREQERGARQRRPTPAPAPTQPEQSP